MGNIIIVMEGLKDTSTTEKEANKFFGQQGFGKVKKLMSINTLAGQGEEGGRSDIVFLLTSDNIMKFGLSSFRFSSGSSWGQDYLDNNRDIIPGKSKTKLVELVRKYGG